MRIFLAAMFAIATLVPMSIEAQAAKKQMCTGTALDGSKVKFSCPAKQKCCFDTMAKKGTCVAATAACL